MTLESDLVFFLLENPLHLIGHWRVVVVIWLGLESCVLGIDGIHHFLVPICLSEVILTGPLVVVELIEVGSIIRDHLAKHECGLELLGLHSELVPGIDSHRGLMALFTLGQMLRCLLRLGLSHREDLVHLDQGAVHFLLVLWASSVIGSHDRRLVLLGGLRQSRLEFGLSGLWLVAEEHLGISRCPLWGLLMVFGRFLNLDQLRPLAHCVHELLVLLRACLQTRFQVFGEELVILLQFVEEDVDILGNWRLLPKDNLVLIS